MEKYKKHWVKAAGVTGGYNISSTSPILKSLLPSSAVSARSILWTSAAFGLSQLRRLKRSSPADENPDTRRVGQRVPSQR